MSSLRRIIEIHAPQKPLCFDTRKAWIEYLESAQVSRKAPKSRPFVDARYRPDFNFCIDCSTQWSQRMKLADRCTPRTYIAEASARAAAQERAEHAA